MKFITKLIYWEQTTLKLYLVDGQNIIVNKLIIHEPKRNNKPNKSNEFIETHINKF